jgi:hypothetical protein
MAIHTITSESTPFYTGNYDRLFCNLDMEIPDDPVYPESHFITRQKVSDFYNVNEFPIRTSIKLFRVENDSLKQKCSGSLISRYHVLTACHCVAKFNIDSLLYDAFWVYPAYDKGKQSPDFGKSQVNKIYFFQHWNINHTDFAILELDQPLGDEAGWIGMDLNRCIAILPMVCFINLVTQAALNLTLIQPNTTAIRFILDMVQRIG